MADVITFSVDNNNDLFLDMNGDISISTNLEAVLEGCEQAVKTQLGELVLQTNLGVPYLDSVFVGVPNISVFQSAIREAILTQPGVIQVVSLETTVTKDNLSYTAVIETDYGNGAING